MSASPRHSYLKLRPRTARSLATLALVALHLWFLLKFLLVKPNPAIELAVGFAGLTGMLSAVIVFLCGYSFLANAPDKDLDERELVQRNAAYFRTHQYTMVMTLAGLLLMEFWERFTHLAISTGQWANFFTVMFFSGMILPATLLAWTDRAEPDAE